MTNILDKPHYLSEKWPISYLLRTPLGSDSRSVYAGSSIDYLKYVTAKNSTYGLRPAMYLERSKFNVSKGNGTQESPYVASEKLSNQAQMTEYDINLEKTFITLEKNGTKTIKLLEENPLVNLSFSSEEPSISSVTAEGKVTGKKYGEVAKNVMASKGGYISTTEK